MPKQKQRGSTEIEGRRERFSVAVDATPAPEAIDHPAHYGNGADDPYEAIKVIFAAGHGVAFCIGNVLKYLLRAGRKPGEDEIKDLEKAAWYLRRYIEHRKGGATK